MENRFSGVILLIYKFENRIASRIVRLNRLQTCFSKLQDFFSLHSFISVYTIRINCIALITQAFESLINWYAEWKVRSVYDR